eukprot:g1876.t1
MPDEDRAKLSVPRLLALLASAIEKAAQDCHNGGRATWGHDIAPQNRRDTSRAADSSSVLRIRDLRRVYNILLFGGPSHNEIIAQAAAEDRHSDSAAMEDDSSSSHDALSTISATISVVSLELRSSRRYDPANALEGLVDELVELSEGLERRHEAEMRRTRSPDAVSCRQGQQQQQQQQQQQYLLPDDCVLHGDSTATATHRSLGKAEPIPWFTDAEFASERSLPDTSKGASLDRCLKSMSTAPLSPAAWTRLDDNAAASGDSTGAPSFWTGSGGSPAARKVASGASEGGGGSLAEAAGHGGTPLARGGLDLCGALSQARVDEGSPIVRELRLALSFPDLEEDRPKDLLEAAQLHEREGSTGDPAGSGRNNVSAAPGSSTSAAGVYPPFLSIGRTPKVAGPPSGAFTENLRRLPRLSTGRRPSGLGPEDRLAPAWGVVPGGHPEGNILGLPPRAFFPAREMEPVGWERTEAEWNDPSFPKWALACAPLVTAEGGGSDSNRAFELCYREHFGGVGLGDFLGANSLEAAPTEAEVARRALAVLQGVPSENFWYDESGACMRVFGHREDDQKASHGSGNTSLPLPPQPRVAGLSPGALASLLKEFAKAGTWYRRVEEFASYLVGRSPSSSQVAHAFGVELRRQLSAIHSALLGVTTELVGLGWSEPDLHSGGGRHAPPARRGCSLARVLVRTARLRRAVGALAEVCGLYQEDLRVLGGVRAVFKEFPRGASLLSLLYKAAEVRLASRAEERGGVEGEGAFGTVMGEKDSALALLSSATAPYLAMLGRWLWSGEIRAEDDPFEEFPLRCRERVAGGVCPTRYNRGGGPKAAKEPWIEDGGGSFMTLAFSESRGAGVPCFLEGGVLAAAARAGKLLHMLKLSSPEFYAACSASPPPPLSLVFGARALASRLAVFERLRLLRTVAGRSAAREIRARVAGKEVRKGMASGVGSEQLLAGERSALGKLELQREQDDASVKEARRIWVQGLEEDRGTSGAPVASAAGAIAATNATAAVVAAADDDAEKPSSEAPSGGGGGGGGGGVLSFLDPPTSEAEAFAAAAITERYRVLGQEADARAARACWKRQRSARAVAARTSLKMLYAEESHLWRRMAAENATAAASHDRPTGNGVVADDSAHQAAEATPSVSPRGDLDGGDGVQNGRVAEETEKSADRKDQAAGDSESGGMEVDVEDAEETAVHKVVAVVPETPDKHEHHEEARFSSLTIVDEPGGKSVSVSAALGGPADETATVRFSHVNIIQDPGGASCGVSGALGENVGGNVSGGGGDDAATAGFLPGRSGLRRIVQEPGGNSSGVSRIMSHGARDAADRASTVGNGAVDGASVDPVPGASIQASGGDLVRSSPRPQGGVTVAAAGVCTVSHGRGRSTLQGEPPSGGPPGRGRPTAAGGIVEGKGRSKGGAAARGRGLSGKLPNGRGFLSDPKEDERVRGWEKDANTSLPLEVIVRRCVREPVLAQCSAVDSAALAFLVRDAGVAEHLASLRTFLLGLTSDFLHDFTLRLLDGLYDGGVNWRRPSNLDAAFAASASATGLDSVPLAETFRYEVDPTCGGILGAKSSQGIEGSIHAGAPPILILPSPQKEKEQEGGLYSPAALSFVSPVLEVKWPVGVLLPTGVLHTYGGIHRSLFRHQLMLHRLRRLRVALRELDACMDASGEERGGGGGRGRPNTAGRRRGRGGVEAGGDGDGGGGRRWRQGAGVSWDRGRLHWLHLFRHEMQHMADSLQTFFAEQAEAGWPDLRRSLSVAGSGGGDGLAALVTAHSRYISRMHRCMFLAADRQGAHARARIEDFYEVVCAVARVTDGLLLSTSSSPWSANGSQHQQHQQQQQQQQQPSDGTREMVLPDGAFAALVAAREKFDAARRGLCGALSEICADGGGARARPLLAVVGYGGYGGQEVAAFDHVSR